jgi:hypothetical protein
MKDGGADPDECHCYEDEREIRRDRKQDQTDQRRSHAEREREGLRMFVRERADERLQERCGELVRQCDQADVAVVEPQLCLQDRVDRRDQRLQCVVYEMVEAEREENAEHRRRRGRAGLDLVDAGRRANRWRFTRGAYRDTVNALGVRA